MSDTSVAVVNGDRVDIETGEIVETLPAVRADGGSFDIAAIEDPTGVLRVAEELVQAVAKRCKGDKYIAPIKGKQYPKVEWWTTVGASLGLFPREEGSRRLDRDGEVAYEATVGVYRGDQLVTRASAMCSSTESLWRNRDEYAIRSMATTRATGKAYRIGLSFLAVMAGLEPTSAEEMPSGDDERPATEKQIGFLRKLLQSRHVTNKEREKMEAIIAHGLTRDKASTAIERLKARLEESDGSGDDRATVEKAEAEKRGETIEGEARRLATLRSEIEAAKEETKVPWATIIRLTGDAVGEDLAGVRTSEEWREYFGGLDVARAEKVHEAVEAERERRSDARES